MSNRLNQEREIKLQPKRIQNAINAIKGLGIEITYEDSTRLEFNHNGSTVCYYPYSGWASGTSIKDGRGFHKLYKQIKNKKEDENI